MPAQTAAQQPAVQPAVQAHYGLLQQPQSKLSNIFHELPSCLSNHTGSRLLIASSGGTAQLEKIENSSSMRECTAVYTCILDI